MKIKSRKEVLASKGYWVSEIQLSLFNEIESFMKKNKMNRTQLASYLGCTKGYVTQLLSGNFDNKLSKLVELSLAIGKVPQIDFLDVDQIILTDSVKYQCEINGMGVMSFSNSSDIKRGNKVIKQLVVAA